MEFSSYAEAGDKKWVWKSNTAVEVITEHLIEESINPLQIPYKAVKSFLFAH